jgi:hypothetical protein
MHSQDPIKKLSDKEKEEEETRERQKRIAAREKAEAKAKVDEQNARKEQRLLQVLPAWWWRWCPMLCALTVTVCYRDDWSYATCTLLCA